MVAPPVEEVEGLSRLELGLDLVAALQSDLRERGADVAGVDREVEVDEDLEGPLEQCDRPAVVAEEVVETGEIVQQARNGRAISERREQLARALGVRARERPRALPLRDERRLEQRVGDAPYVGGGLGELERSLDVLLRGDPVAVAAVAARAPVEHVRAKPVGEDVVALGQREHVVEEDDRLGDP